LRWVPRRHSSLGAILRWVPRRHSSLDGILRWKEFARRHFALEGVTRIIIETLAIQPNYLTFTSFRRH
jgi:hypothetical protein